MRNADLDVFQAFVTVVMFVIAVAIVLALVGAWFGLIAWVVQLTAAGFGSELPFWPVLGVVFLVHVVMGLLGRTLRSK